MVGIIRKYFLGKNEWYTKIIKQERKIAEKNLIEKENRNNVPWTWSYCSRDGYGNDRLKSDSVKCHPLSAGGGGAETPTKFSKSDVGLDSIKICREGLLGKWKVTLFRSDYSFYIKNN